MKLILITLFFACGGFLFCQDSELIKNIKDNNLAKVSEILNADKDGKLTNVADSYGYTPLMWAMWSGNLGMVKALIEKGALIDNELSDSTAFEIVDFNDYQDIKSYITSKEVILKNLSVEIDDISGDETIKSYLFTKEELPSKVANFRVFAKLENGELYYVVGLKLLNNAQKQVNGTVYANKKQFETYVKPFNDTFYKNTTYFTELYTVLFKKEDFVAFANMQGDIPFGIRRGTIDFDFSIPAACFQAILEKSDVEFASVIQQKQAEQQAGQQQGSTPPATPNPAQPTPATPPASTTPAPAQ